MRISDNFQFNTARGLADKIGVFAVSYPSVMPFVLGWDYRKKVISKQ